MDSLLEKRWKLVHYICDFIASTDCPNGVPCHKCAQSHPDDIWFEKEVTDDENDKR